MSWMTRAARVARAVLTGAAEAPAAPARPAAEQDPSAALLSAVGAGQLDLVPALLEPLDDRARRALLPELKRLRSENRWDRAGVGRAAHLAGAGCHTAPAACAAWLAPPRAYGVAQDPDVLLSVLAGRPPQFLAAVTERLAARRELTGWELRFLHRMAAAAGIALPATEFTATGWHLEVQQQVRRRCRCPRSGAAAEPQEACGALLAVLRDDPLTPRMIAVLLDTTERCGQLVWHTCTTSGHVVDTWPGALAVLAADGVIDRGQTVRTAVAVTLRGTGASADVRFCVALLRAMALTAAEDAALAADWIRAACDAPADAAGYAQERLRGLWDAGLLTPDQLAETAGGVFFRTEKKLLRTQLTWLDAAMKSRPDTAAVLLPALADAFGHLDTALVERALRIAGRRLSTAGDATRERVLAGASALGPGLLPLAAALLHAPDLAPAAGSDAAGTAAGHRDVLPAPRPAAPMPPAPASTEELVAGITDALEANLYGRMSAASFEWALDGVVRGVHRDRKAVTAALEPVVDPYRGSLGWNSKDGTWLQGGGRGLLLVLAAATGRLKRRGLETVRTAPARDGDADRRVAGPWRLRLVEVAAGLLAADVPPCLLSTPSCASGSLDADELLGRLRAYRDLGVRAWPADLDLALLRVRRPDDPAAAAAAAHAARALGTADAARLADRLTAAEPSEPGPARVRVDGASRWPYVALAYGPSAALGAAFPALTGLGSGHTPRGGWSPDVYAHSRYWVSMLPGRPDTAAAHLIGMFATDAMSGSVYDAGLLLSLAEAPGTPGPAVHLALAYGLSARRPEDRLVAVDALLALAGRGALDAGRLGADLAELLGLGAVKANRVADAMGTVVAGGAPGTAWAVLAGVLEPLLGPGAEPLRGAGSLVAVAVSAVESSGVRGAAPWLAAAAARPGAARLTAETRRLHRTLTP